LKPLDEDFETPSEEEEVEEVEAIEPEIDQEPVMRKPRRSRGRRTRQRRQYATMGAFVIWAGFILVWLFVFAEGYSLIQNIGVSIASFLIAAAGLGFYLIPTEVGSTRETRRIRATLVLIVFWIVFIVLWLTMLAAGYGIFENIGVAIASFMITGAIIAMLWIPDEGRAGWRIRVSVLSGIGWIVFMVIWLPFYHESFLIYHSLAIMLLAFLVMILLVGGAWGSMVSREIRTETGGRGAGSIALFGVWLIFLILWLWFFAETISGYQNISVTLISVVVIFAIMLGVWRDELEDSRTDWIGTAIGFVWVILLIVWFWFFAETFNFYQNLAVFLLSVFVFAAMGAALGRKRWRDFEAMDFPDDI
jgi:peptidoglycan/LPS O-acetylase OafA/YrhL